MASLKDVEQLADDLEELVGRLRSELRNGPDFEKLIQIADDLSEHADNAATTFNTVNDALMSRLNEVKGSSRGTRRASSGASTKQKVS